MYLQSGNEQLTLRLMAQTTPRGVVKAGRFEDEQVRYSVWSPLVADLDSLVERAMRGLHHLIARHGARGHRHAA